MSATTAANPPQLPSLAPPTTVSNEREKRAKEYVKRVEATLSTEEYKKFLGIMARFKKRQLTKRGLIAEVDDLFCDLDRAELLGGFEVFLPQGVTVDMVREGNSKCSTFSYASLSKESATNATPLEETDAIPPLPSPDTPTTAVAAEPPLAFVHPKRVHSDPTDDSNPKKPHLDSKTSTPVVLDSADLPALPIQSSKQLHPHDHRSSFNTHKPASTASSGRRQSLSSVSDGANVADPSDELMIDFSYKVQMRFLEANTPEKYKTFLSLLSTSRASPSSYPAAIFQATQLLKSHPDLLSEFKSLVARVSFAGIQPALISSSPNSGGAPVVGGGASAAAGRKGHRKSKSLSTWPGITPIGSDEG
ncbi:hypothetical protein HDU98_003818, partial [Podochytrium sp. JEL0797]